MNHRPFEYNYKKQRLAPKSLGLDLHVRMQRTDAIQSTEFALEKRHVLLVSIDIITLYNLSIILSVFYSMCFIIFYHCILIHFFESQAPGAWTLWPNLWRDQTLRSLSWHLPSMAKTTQRTTVQKTVGISCKMQDHVSKFMSHHRIPTNYIYILFNNHVKELSLLVTNLCNMRHLDVFCSIFSGPLPFSSAGRPFRLGLLLPPAVLGTFGTKAPGQGSIEDIARRRAFHPVPVTGRVRVATLFLA